MLGCLAGSKSIFLAARVVPSPLKLCRQISPSSARVKPRFRLIYRTVSLHHQRLKPTEPTVSEETLVVAAKDRQTTISGAVCKPQWCTSICDMQIVGRCLVLDLKNATLVGQGAVKFLHANSTVSRSCSRQDAEDGVSLAHCRDGHLASAPNLCLLVSRPVQASNYSAGLRGSRGNNIDWLNSSVEFWQRVCIS